MLSHKKFLAGCAVLAVCGAVLAAIGIAFGGVLYGISFDSSGMHVSSPRLEKEGGQRFYEQKEETVEAFERISVDLAYADVRVKTSDSDAYTISYCLKGKDSIEYEVDEGTLFFQQKSKVSYANFQFNFFWWGRDLSDTGMEEYLEISVPKNAGLSSIEVYTENGNAVYQNIHADSLKVVSDYGDVRLQEVQAQNIEAEMENGMLQMDQITGTNCKVLDQYGDIRLSDVTLAGDIQIETENGEIRFEQVTGKGCKVENQYGDMNLSDVKFSADMEAEIENGDVSFQNVMLRDLNLQNSYGNISGQQTEFRNLQLDAENGDCVFDNALFDNCAANLEFGNIRLALANPVTDYVYKLKTEYGEIEVDGENMGESYVSLEKDKEKSITIECSSGDVTINGKGDDI